MERAEAGSFSYGFGTMAKDRTRTLGRDGQRLVIVLIALTGAGPVLAEDRTSHEASDGVAFFESKIRPVLIDKCYACHSRDAEELQGGLVLDSRAGVLNGGDSGPAVVPGNPAESLLLQSLKYQAYEMPPTGRLPEAVIEDFEHWIAIGMPDPRTEDAVMPRQAIDIEQGRKFWSFQPIESPQPPATRNTEWPLGDIDRFILAKLEEHGLAPSADADRATWLRRVTFALLGLPPTLDELDAFLADDSPDAFARVVDRMLASHHFGERWGRHWLDVARFAESSGGGRSLLFKDAWRYRDYVIDSANLDKPVDQFIVEQIAGDLLPHATAAEEREHLVATGYLMLGAHNYEEQDKRALEMDVVDEQLDTIGRGLLGMTIACARCHDHKFDPIPTSDYYALAGILRSTNTLVHENVSGWTTRPLPLTDAEVAANDEYNSAVAAAEREFEKAKTAAESTQPIQLAALKQAAEVRSNKVAELLKRAPERPKAMAALESKTIEDCRICIRGSVRHRGPAVPRGVLQVATLGSPPTMPAHQSGRKELAEWIASPQNPLTVRVYVNRVWSYVFGAGLVRTPDNFGTAGEFPSDAELLDYLASRFVQDGWSTKRLVRDMVLSHAYRMGATENPDAAAIDPENRLLWRMNRVRLDAESLRDSMLVVSGKLDWRIGGPNISIPKGASANAMDQTTEYNYVFADCRRSIYTPAFRNRTHELFEVFDFADPNGTVSKRDVTTVAPQALAMLNSPFVIEQARFAAERLLASGNMSDEARIEQAFRETLGRGPSDAERAIALAAIAPMAVGDGGGGEQLADVSESVSSKWATLYQGLFGCIDFRYVQ
jgi:hypothetical protein